MDNNRPGIIKVTALLWLIACLVFYARHGSDVLQLQLADSDDYMRLVQVSRWIDVADWYDLTQPRMNPPDGVEMHWTRLPDLPIAVIIVTLQDWIGRYDAMVVAAFVAPALMLLGILLAAVWAARPVLKPAVAPIAALATVMALPLIVHFAPGRLDHHSWQLLFAMLGLGALLRMLLCPGTVGPAVLAAGVGALALWVSMEALPWIVAFSLALAVSWVFWSKQILRAAFVFSIALFAFCLLVLSLARPPGQWFVLTCDSFSLAYVGLAGAIFLFWSGLWFARNAKTLGMRFVVAVLCGVATTAVLVLLFPGCLSHPYKQVDPNLAKVWIDNIEETRSIFSLASKRAVVIPYFLTAPLLGLVVAVLRVKNTLGRTRLIWVTLTVHLGLALFLSLVQVRFFSLAHLYAVIPIAWLLGTLSYLIERRWNGLRRAILMIGALFAVGPVPSFALIMAVGLPGGDKAIERCDIQSLEPTLVGSLGSRVVASFINPGAELLFRTPHSVLAAGYHRNAAGNLHAFNLFSAQDDVEAFQIVQDRGVDLILICPSATEVRIYKNRGYQTFVERLIDGKIPFWLQPLPVSEKSSELLFQVSVPTDG